MDQIFKKNSGWLWLLPVNFNLVQVWQGLNFALDLCLLNTGRVCNDYLPLVPPATSSNLNFNDQYTSENCFQLWNLLIPIL